MTDNTIQAAAHIGDKPYMTTLSAGAFSLIADEPEDKGGTNLGPTPQTLLCMSLAACTVITLRMYAERKQWQLGEIFCDVQLVTTPEGTRFFERKITCQHTPDADTINRLLLVADKCPVHKLLSTSNEIKSAWPVA